MLRSTRHPLRQIEHQKTLNQLQQLALKAKLRQSMQNKMELM
jgi:hypothetical protein